MALVWYSAWQMECCGQPFSVNDRVEWNLTEEPEVDWIEAAVGVDLAVQVTHQEDHHELDGNAVAGRGGYEASGAPTAATPPDPGATGSTPSRAQQKSGQQSVSTAPKMSTATCASTVTSSNLILSSTDGAPEPLAE